jgi:large subunit ribosomal protein L21e
MVKSSKGFRARTRGTFRKHVRERGMPPVTRFLTTFEVGDRVVIRIESSQPKGMPHPRYQGRVGTVRARVGRSYLIAFRDGGKEKQVIAHPVHLLAMAKAPTGGS